MNQEMKGKVKKHLEESLERLRGSWAKGGELDSELPPGKLCASVALGQDKDGNLVSSYNGILFGCFEVLEGLAGENLVTWNDGQDSEQAVVELYERAIASLA